MSRPRFTRETLLAKITSARQAFDTCLARVPAAQMETPILHDAWTVKDLLGHLGFWEAQTVARFDLLRSGGTPERIADMDALNIRVLAETRRQALDEVRAHEQESYRRLLELVRNASPDELFDPAHFPAAKGRAFLGWIEGNTWDHYQEHLPELTAWLDGAGRA